MGGWFWRKGDSTLTFVLCQIYAGSMTADRLVRLVVCEMLSRAPSAAKPGESRTMRASFASVGGRLPRLDGGRCATLQSRSSTTAPLLQVQGERWNMRDGAGDGCRLHGLVIGGEISLEFFCCLTRAGRFVHPKRGTGRPSPFVPRPDKAQPRCGRAADELLRSTGEASKRLSAQRTRWRVASIVCQVPSCCHCRK